VDQFTNLILSKYGRDISEMLSPVLGVHRKFSLNDFTETIPNSDTFLTTSYDEATCTCSNFVLEGYYTLYFAQNSTQNETTGTVDEYYYIQNVTLDLVYGDYTPDTCSETVSLTQKT